MKDKYLLFRLVPTMRCNFKCNYCFLTTDEKGVPGTMFDFHSVDEWVRAMEKFSEYKVEFYCWGGEPFILDDTYELVKGWVAYDHVISGSRLDTNMAFAEKIAQRCPTNKVKLNCSWHPQYFTLEVIYNKVKQLNELGMVGMLNFVASTFNLNKLETDYRMTVDDLIAKFADIGVFVNVAADFSLANDKTSAGYEEYKRFILRYTNPDDWKHLRQETGPALCTANRHFFTIQPNGDITPCLSNEVCGNFFEGTLHFPELSVCNKECPSIVAYPFRTDNNFVFTQHLQQYVNRNKQYRASLAHIGKVFDMCRDSLSVAQKVITSSDLTPLVSIVLPTYNHLSFLPKSIESLLLQTFTEFELIIVNDGSTDGTMEFLDSLSDPRIRVIHQVNKRLPGALNTGFSAARGELLTWVSADNYCAPKFLESFVAAFDHYPEAGFAYSAFAWIDETGGIIGDHRDQNMNWYNAIKANPGIASFMYKRDCLEKLGGYGNDLEGAEDWDMWLRIVEKYSTIYVPDVLYFYRLHDGSMSSLKQNKITETSRQTVIDALQRFDARCDIINYFPFLDKCPVCKKMENFCWLILGINLLTSPFAPPEIAVRFLKTAFSRDLEDTSFYNLTLAYAKAGYWDEFSDGLRYLRRSNNTWIQQKIPVLDLMKTAHNTPEPLPIFDLREENFDFYMFEKQDRKTFSLRG